MRSVAICSSVTGLWILLKFADSDLIARKIIIFAKLLFFVYDCIIAYGASATWRSLRLELG